MPHYILLTGAGFSRNWGGWLAEGAFNYVLSRPIDESIRTLLLQYRNNGGFEKALDDLQDEREKQRREKLEDAILEMFAHMNRAFDSTDFEFQNHVEFSVTRFLGKFDAIFTLNQDLLIERHYLCRDDLGLLLHPKWNGGHMPGMQRNDAVAVFGGGMPQKWSPINDPSQFVVEKNLQPYFKLHGSSNWFYGGSGRPVLVMGGNKPDTIKRHRILEWNGNHFAEYLSKPDTRLMIIGYSFRDEHINRTIRTAARPGFKLFIVDPDGIDVLDKDHKVPIRPVPPIDPNFVALGPCLIGASKLALSESFGRNRVEHDLVMTFFG